MFLLQPIFLLSAIILSTSATDIPDGPSTYKAALSIRSILLGRQDLCPDGWLSCIGTTTCCAPTERCWQLSNGGAHCCPSGRQGCLDGRCCGPGTTCRINLRTNVVSCEPGSPSDPLPPVITTIFRTTTSLLPPTLPPAKTTTITTITTPPPAQNACNCPPDSYCLRDSATNQPQCWSDTTYTWTYYYYYWSVTWWYTTTIYLENFNRNSIVAFTTPPPPASLTGSVPPPGLPTTSATHVNVIPTIAPPVTSTKIVCPTATPTLHKSNSTHNSTYGSGVEESTGGSAVGVGYSWEVMFALLGAVLFCTISGL